MTERLSQEKAQQAIDLLLEDKSDEFKAVVFELCRQLGWPDDEPSFLLAIATNQLEALIRQYPERISEAMATAAGELEHDWRQIQAELSLTVIQNTQTLNRMTLQLTDAQLAMHEAQSRAHNLFGDQQQVMLKVMADERAAVQRLLADERTAMAQLAQELAVQQKQVIEAHTTDLITQAMLSWRERADSHVKQLIKEVKAQRYWQSIAFACIAILIVVVTAWLGGWVSSSRAQAVSTWGDIERWNGDALKACQDAEIATCNMHIQLPQA